MLSNTKLKELCKLKTKKGRSQQGRFLIEGVRLCEEAAASSWPVETVLFATSFGEKAREKKLLKSMQSLDAELIQTRNRDLARLSDTVTTQGIVCVVKAKERSTKDLWKKDILGRTGRNMILGLDGISDPGNVGTLIRTADAFGASAVLLSQDTVELYNPKVVRSTMGSIFHLPVFNEADLGGIVPQLKKRRFRIVGTDVRKGRSFGSVRFPRRACLLIGSEAKGLSRELLNLCDQVVRIPIYGRAESLNAAVAAGILMHEVTRRLARG
jgi:TrmH family RNA methyltransferase